MKKETRRVVIPADYYIADDGTEFTSEQQCLVYEQAVEEEKQYAIAESLPHFRYAPPITDTEADYVWTFCKTKEELYAVFIKYLCEEERNHYSGTELNEIPLPGWVVTCSDDSGYGYINSAEIDLGFFEKFVNEVRRLMACDGKEEMEW